MKKILVIDDQLDNIISVKAILKNRMPDCQILAAQSGKEGIEVCKKELPDTILLDIIMPEMDGYETCSRLKQNPETNFIPIIMLTAIKTDSESRAKGLNLGADAFLSKPIDAIELTAQLNVMLRIKKAEDELRAEKMELDALVNERTSELEESERKMRSIYRVAPTGIGMVRNRVFTEVNRKFCEMLGYSSHELIGKSSRILYPTEKEYEFVGKVKYGQIDKKGSGIVETCMQKKDGSLIQILLASTPFDSGDLEKGVIFTALDITERKRTEQIQKVLYNISNAVTTASGLDSLIATIRKELAEIIDTTNFFIALYDKENDSLSLPYFVDEKDKWDLPPKGKTLTKYVINTQQSLLANIDRKKQMAKEGLIEHVGSLSKIWLGVPLKINEQVIGVLSVQSYKSEDAFSEADMKMLEFVSDQVSLSVHRKRNEEKLILAHDRALESDRLKSAFLANMSHEIRTPMNGILGFSDLLKEPGLSGDQQQKYISVIERSGKRMLNIINDLIDISKIEAGQTETVIAEVNIRRQFDYLFSFFAPEAEKKGLTITAKNLLPENQSVIFTDQDKFYAIIANLIKNAVKYTNEGSIDFGYQIKDNFVECYVRDTGVGIAKQKQKLIFERFVQADHRLSSLYEGAGLGLAISKAYVEMLGGKIWVESTLGKGSVFYFRLPIDKTSKEKPAEADQTIVYESAKLDELKIVVAEDEETAREFLKIILKGKELLFAKTGIEAVDLCKKHNDIDLVLMDIKMPGMDGYQATKEIRRFNKDLTIIAQTAFSLAGDRERILDAGCDDYIAKPINRKKLEELIGKHFTF